MVFPVCWPWVSASALALRTSSLPLPWLTTRITSTCIRCLKLPKTPAAAGVVAPQCSGESWGYKSDISPPLRLWPSGKPPPSAFLGSAFTVGEPQGGSKPRSRSVLAQPMDPMQSVSLAPFFLFGRFPCRVLLKNLGPPMGQVGYVVLPLPKLGRPVRCCLNLPSFA